MSQDLYKEKYVKYKSKYLNLKNVEGGARLSPGRYFFYVPVSVFNTIVAHIYFTRLNKSITMTSQSSKSTVTAPVADYNVVSVEGPGSEVILNIMESNKSPSYQVQPGNSNFLNLKDVDNPLTLFNKTTQKFGIDQSTTSTTSKSGISKKSLETVTEAKIQLDLAIFKTKAEEDKKTNRISDSYVLMHYEVSRVSKPNVFYANSDKSSGVHPILSHLNKIQKAIEDVTIVPA